MATLAELSIKADTSQVVKADQDLKKLGNTAQNTEKKTDGFTAGAGKATKASSGFSNGARNLSLQLSQVAQQGSVTGNYFQALAIQLPDIMLSFGTLGILVGAAAGVLGVGFANAASEASKETSTLSDEIDQLVDSYDDLGNKQRDLIRLKIAEETAKLNKETRIAQGDVKTYAFQLDRLISQYDKGRIGIIEYKDEYARLNKLITDNSATIEANNATIAERNKVLDGSKQKAEELAAVEIASLQSRADALQRLETVEAQIANSSLSTQARAIDAAENRNSMLAQAYSDDLISFERYKELKTQNQQNLQDDLSQIEEQGMRQRQQILTDGQQAALGAAGALFGNLAAIAKEGGKKQFDEYKALASAQAAISAALAISQALAAVPPPLNIVLASSIGALTAVQIAKINQQEYTGARALGGQVQGGNKYLVGENGPEVVTMGANGYVTPNSQLGGGAQVTQVFNFSAGVTRAELAGVLPQVAEAAKQATLAALSKGGSASQAVRRRA